MVTTVDRLQANNVTEKVLLAVLRSRISLIFRSAAYLELHAGFLTTVSQQQDANNERKILQFTREYQRDTPGTVCTHISSTRS